MPLPVFPATAPKPDRVESYGEEWPAIERDFDSVFSQVRQLTNRGLRHFSLHYLNLTPQNRDELQRFFNLRKGKSERFDLTIPWPLLDDPGFEKGTTTEWAFDTGTAITTTPANVRSGIKAGEITALNGTERRIRNLQKFPLFPGDTLTVSGYAKGSQATGAIGTIFVELFNSADAVIQTITSGDVTLTTSYAQYASAAVAVNALVVYGRLMVRSTSGATTGRILYFDDLLVELTIPCRFDAIRLDWRFKPPSFWSVNLPFAEAP